MGIQGHALATAGTLREMVAVLVRQGFQDADSSDPRRARFPRALHAGIATFHRVAGAESAVETHRLSTRGPWGAEAAEQPAVVPELHRLDHGVDGQEVTGGTWSHDEARLR